MQSDVERLLFWQSDGTKENFEEVNRGMERLVDWVYRHVVGNDVFPRELPVEFQEALSHVSVHVEKIKSVIADQAEIRCQLTLRLMQLKTPFTAESISEQDYYLCRALGVLGVPSGFRSEYECLVSSRGRNEAAEVDS